MHEALPAIMEMAISGPRDAKLAAIEAIGLLGADGAHDFLADILAGGNPPLQRYAAQALADMGDKRATAERGG